MSGQHQPTLAERDTKGYIPGLYDRFGVVNQISQLKAVFKVARLKKFVKSKDDG